MSDQTIKGVDVSHHQSGLDWSSLAKEGYAFAFIKATEGQTYQDPQFEKHWAAASDAKLKVGPYHFYSSTDDPREQATFFIQTIRHYMQPSDLPPVLDFENGSIKAPINPQEMATQVLTWLQEVEQVFSRKPIIYTDVSTANQYLMDPTFKDYPLWIASYQTSPELPKTWADVGYAFWQTGQKNLQGISVDIDVFHGTEAELKNLEITNRK